MRSEFTGKHMAVILIGGFGLVIAVNFYMASLAIGGFGGVVVENSYVASQKFNGWLEQARDSERLGYSASLERGANGMLVVTTADIPQFVILSADIRRPLGKREDMTLHFEQVGQHQFVSTRPLPQGRWIVRLAIEADGSRWVNETELP